MKVQEKLDLAMDIIDGFIKEHKVYPNRKLIQDHAKLHGRHAIITDDGVYFPHNHKEADKLIEIYGGKNCIEELNRES